FSIAFTHLSLLSSKEMPIIFKPRSLYLLYIATTCGFSFRHGAHQDAQKSMMVYFPRFFLSDWGLLWTSLSVKSSNLAPITTNSYSFKKVANFLPFSVCLCLRVNSLHNPFKGSHSCSVSLLLSLSSFRALV